MLVNKNIGDTLKLNFLLTEPQDIKFVVFRKIRAGKEKRDEFSQQNIRSYSLVKTKEKGDRQSYWISFEKLEGFEKYNCKSNENIYLTEQYLFNCLLSAVNICCPDKIVKMGGGFNKRRVYIELKDFSTGKQTFWHEPYFLKTTNCFGFLIDFHFHQNSDTIFSKEIQRLSLSLDAFYRSNKSYHQDKYQLLESFVGEIVGKLNLVLASKWNISILNSLTSIKYELLETKKYKFGENKTHNSQFVGIKEYGPFHTLGSSNNHYYYVFTDKNIDLGRDLFRALNGDTYKYTFPGMKEMFRYEIGQNNISKLSISDYTISEIKRIAEIIVSEPYSRKIAIIIFPEKEENFYFSFKNILLKEGILSQGIHIETLRDGSGLKWSISSIGLQLFSKSGGIPWRVVPSNEDCLIIGIGQAHRIVEINGRKTISRYFAYSVLTDSSGKYVSMNILSNETKEEEYLKRLQTELTKIITKYQKEYSKITLHIPFKIRTYELNKIRETLESLNISKEFVVLKINDRSKYFAYNKNVNSLVPFESSIVKLSQSEFLLFSEGINFHNLNANKRYSNPLHIEFYYSNLTDIPEEKKLLYLQDILNLSGANWRGFNAKSSPISVFYPEIISHFIKEFDMRQLPEIKFENLPPWFL